MVCCDHWVWERVWELTLESFGICEFGELREFLIREVKSMKFISPKVNLEPYI
jgi:hypothetical protein